jgi:hypothetical protein
MLNVKYSLAVFPLLLAISSCANKESPVGVGTPQYTMIGGHLGSIMLSAVASPYLVRSNLIVDSTSTLVIDAGTQLYFEDSTEIIVYGRLLCQGSRYQSILLTSKNLSWKGIQLLESSFTSTLSFVIVENVDVTIPDDTTRNGAVEIEGVNAVVQNSIFRNNRSNNGGGLFIDHSQSVVTNNIFFNNYAAVFGGGIFSSFSSNKIVNNTFYQNSTDNYGGGLLLMTPVLDLVQNNIFFANTSRTGDAGIAVYETDSTHVNAEYNFLQLTGDNPDFVSQTDFHLLLVSPCINAGNPEPMYDDADGSRNDQGAYGGPLGGW